MSFLKRLFGRASAPSDSVVDWENTSLGQKLSPFRRKAWLPRTREGDCAKAGSKFSGLAFIPKGDEWPRCGNCEHPMQLFLQLNANDIPDECQLLRWENLAIPVCYLVVGTLQGLFRTFLNVMSGAKNKKNGFGIFTPQRR